VRSFPGAETTALSNLIKLVVIGNPRQQHNPDQYSPTGSPATTILRAEVLGTIDNLPIGVIMISLGATAGGLLLTKPAPHRLLPCAGE
jgi:hypothetical protein